MAANTKIEWADHTFNPWVGCARVGPGCDHCYAETWAKRTGAPELWDGERRRTKTWRDPIKWDKQAADRGIRYRVFCASLADVFDNAVPDAWRRDLWTLIRWTPRLDWIILTKRIGNAAKMLPPDWGDGWPHVWLLATICNQAEADRDIPKLLATPAAVRGISYEPALGPVDLRDLSVTLADGIHQIDALVCEDHPADCGEIGTAILDWIICGGESGPRARPMYPDWARSVRDQCQAAGVAFFFKQWGEWRDDLSFVRENDLPDERYIKASDARYIEGEDGLLFCRVGKKRAGALLDGREWLEFPGVR